MNLPIRREPSTWFRRANRVDSEDGMGGVEVLPVAALVTIFVTLLVMSAWNVIDAKFAATAAAREGARVAVEEFDAGSAVRAANRTWLAHGRKGTMEVEVSGAVARCGRFVVTVSSNVEPLSLPVVSRWSAVTVRSTHSEVFDAHRPGLSGTATC
jgi:hypothetical protein